ncbi:MAG: recombinase family protein, partial [Paracraurococcus sp.]
PQTLILIVARLASRLSRYIEVDSGRRKDRPELAAALAACHAMRATLVIARLDRLARNVAFVLNLMKSGVESVATDMPVVNRLTVHVLAAVAEEEARAVSARTKAALAAAKARGCGSANRACSRASHPSPRRPTRPSERTRAGVLQGSHPTSTRRAARAQPRSRRSPRHSWPAACRRLRGTALFSGPGTAGHGRGQLGGLKR